MTYFVNDFKNHEDMITKAILNIMIKKYHNYCVYVHNLSGFDGIFLFGLLSITK